LSVGEDANVVTGKRVLHDVAAEVVEDSGLRRKKNEPDFLNCLSAVRERAEDQNKKQVPSVDSSLTVLSV
jgi:hypothetical protein